MKKLRKSMVSRLKRTGQWGGSYSLGRYLRGSSRGWPSAGPWAGPRQTETPQPFPILGMYILPTIPTLRAVSKVRPWDNTVLLRPSGQYTVWTTSRPLYKLLRFWWAGVEICLACSTQDKLHMYKSPGLLSHHLPVCSGLPLFSSLFVLWTESIFSFHLPRKLLRLWTNRKGSAVGCHYCRDGTFWWTPWCEPRPATNCARPVAT